MNYWTQSKNNIWVAAHRGWRTKYPENTVEAFRGALELGVDQIETDVRISRDGELVLIHDATVDRTTDGTGKVCDKLLAELKALDAGSWKGEEFRGARIPVLTELMELVKDHPTMTLDIELKERPGEVADEVAYSVCDRILAIVEDYHYSDRVVLNTFSGKLHEYINDKYGKKYRQHLYYPVTHMGKGMTRDPYSYGYCCCMFSAMYGDLNMAEKMDYDRMAARGVEPWSGACVKDEIGVDRSIANGATLITCDNPDVILDLLRKKGYHK